MPSPSALDPPAPERTLTLSVLALAVAGGALALVVTEPIVRAFLEPFPHDGPPRDPNDATLHLVAVAVSTVVLLGCALSLALRYGAARWVHARTILLCAVFGWLNAGASLALGSALCGDLQEAAQGALIGLFLGLFVAAPIGFGYGLVAAPAVGRLLELRGRPSLALRAMAARLVGAATLGASVIGLSLAATGWTEQVPVWVPASLTGLGAVVLAVAQLRLSRLRGMATAPERYGLTRVPLDELGLSAGALWPLDPSVSEDAGFALVRAERAVGDGGYRAAQVRRPLALVD